MQPERTYLTIKQARELRGLKQEYVAMKLGLCQPNYSKMENGQRSFSEKYLIMLSVILNIRVDFLRNNQIPIVMFIVDD